MNYIKITPYDIANGVGVRVVLWLAGCEHHCFKCHNHETWDPSVGKPFTDEVLEDLIKKVNSPHVQGITLSGGDPLATYNRADVAKVVKAIRERCPGKDIWIYSGYTYEQLQTDPVAVDVLDHCDIFVDGRFQIENYAIDLHWKGSSNQRVIDLNATRLKGVVTTYC